MKLVETDAEGPPVDGSLIMPLPPVKRRVSVSLVFTLAVLGGTIGIIYTLFPPAYLEAQTRALQEHASPAPAASRLTAPSPGQLEAWLKELGAPHLTLPTGATLLYAHSELMQIRVEYQWANESVSLRLEPGRLWAPVRQRTEGAITVYQTEAQGWRLSAVGASTTTAWPTLSPR